MLFKDYDCENDGFLELSSIKSYFNGFNNKLLFILDCCYSGEGLAFATNTESESEVSVLSACNSYSPARFDKNGSLFTNSLCNGIQKIIRNDDTFSLNTLVTYIKDSGYHGLQVNMGAGNSIDLVFKKNCLFTDNLPNFCIKFVNEIHKGNILTREALWYSLDSMSSSLIADVCEMYFNQKSNYLEASWLVRRAIGSTLGNHIYHERIEKIALKLLLSHYWQLQCIGIIAFRKTLTKRKDVCHNLIELIKNKRISKIDAVWLANLYLSETKYYPFDLFCKTSLKDSLWGTMELFKAQINHLGHKEALKYWEGSKYYNYLTTEYNFINDPQNIESHLIRYIYATDSRGRVPSNIKSKFLYSALYGNWRNQIQLDLKTYFDTYKTNVIAWELKEAYKIPNVERKMALFSFLSDNNSIAKKYAEYVMWGLNDPHPWVKRTAIQFFAQFKKYADILKTCYFEHEVNDFYPGNLDMYLLCPEEYKLDLLEIIGKKNSLTDGDFRSLKDAIINQ